MALLAGILLGLAELTKMTWVLLFAVWPLIWLAWLWERRRNEVQLPRGQQALQLGSILAIGLLVLNVGYSFDGTFTRLGDFTFVSRTLAGQESVVDAGHGGNRFAESWLRYVPIPLPKSYVEGVDLQKVDFERGLRSYLCGQWSQHGWWYYYLVCAILKVPLGIWAMGLLAVAVRVGRLNSIGKKHVGRAESRADWLDEAVLLLPAIALIVFVSSQTGFSRHFRYVLPAFPFMFVWIGSVAQEAIRRPWPIGGFVTGSLTWMVLSSLSIYPHSMSYFNELAGGPIGGPRYLLDANIDWGQDVLYLKEWCERHPEAAPIFVGFSNSHSEALLGLGDRVRNLDLSEATSHDTSTKSKPREHGTTPGWYAVSVHRLHDPDDSYQGFRTFTPMARAGFSIFVYRLSLAQANRVRRGIGLAELTGSEAEEL